MKESTSLSNLVLESALSLNDESLIVQAYLENAYCLWYTGEYDKGIEIINTTQIIMTRSDADYKKLFARSQLIHGNLVGDQGDLDKCLEYYADSMKLYQSIGDNDGTAYVLNNLGTLYQLQGNLDEALICYEKSGELFKELNNPLSISMSLGNIGYVYLEKGDLDFALEYLLNAHTILEKINDKLFLPEIKTSIGKFYYFKGQYETSLPYFKQSLDLYEASDNKVWISATLLYYILSYCEIDNNRAEELLLKFDAITENTEVKSKLIDIRYKLAKAMVLKKTNRLEYIVPSQKMLHEIVYDDEIIQYEVTLMAMKNLADLLILELKLNDDEIILAELINLISKLNDQSLIHGSHRTQVQTYILFAKLKLLSGEFQAALDTLEIAQKLATEKGLEKLVKEVSNEKEQIVLKANMYDKAFGHLTDIQEKLKHEDIEAYLNEILANGILHQKQGSSGSGGT